MLIDELNNLVASCNMNNIRRKLRKLGYINCARDKRFRDINLFTIMSSDNEETETHTTNDGDYQYYGNIYRNVSGFSDCEFIEITKNKIYHDRDFSFPYRDYIYVLPRNSH